MLWLLRWSGANKLGSTLGNPSNETLRPIKLCLFGASPDTANLGVSALFLSTLHAISMRYPNAQVTVFDYGYGLREDEIELNNKTFRFMRCGANLSRRIYRKDSLFNMRISAKLGGLSNPGVKAIAEADAVFDISGGDSFADIYGMKRFNGITQPKQLSIDLDTPLILLPQTYGPFDLTRTRQKASAILKKTSMAWARDERSFESLKELLGQNFDRQKHCSGVDVAFALPKKEPSTLSDQLKSWIAENPTVPLVGFNVSGLIYNQGAEGSRQFGFKDDYREIVLKMLKKFLDESEARILLVPHVLAQLGHYESDPQACKDVAAKLGSSDRIHVLEGAYDAMEMKWVISNLGFFCGTRMHSTIAGLSSGVPTAAIAYSKKTLGVFEVCGQGRCVTDPRHVDAEQCVRDIWNVWLEREAVSSSLRENLPQVVQRTSMQFSQIFDHIERQKSGPGTSGFEDTTKVP